MSERTLQERLRNPPDSLTGSPCVDETTADEAADRIDALEKALSFYANPTIYYSELRFAACNHRIGWEKTPVLVDDGEIARAVLNPKEPT